MVNAFSEFVQKQTVAKKWRNRDLERASGLSRQLTSKYLNDTRDHLTRLPPRETVVGFAQAFHVPVEFLIAKGIEALGIGYSSGDFINGVTTATNRELLEEIGKRLAEREEVMGNAEHPAPNTAARLRAARDTYRPTLEERQALDEVSKVQPEETQGSDETEGTA